MRVFAVSDIHIDYKDNRRWLLDLSSFDYQQDVLILAGDISDDLLLLRQCFDSLQKKFTKVLFVPGNHELWLKSEFQNATAGKQNSIQKFLQVNQLANDFGVSTSCYENGELTIVPLLSWYDFSFAEPCEKLKSVWMDFRFCIWPDNMQPLDITRYFMAQNVSSLNSRNQSLISFSHFLPRIDLMPFYIPHHYRYLYPALGSQLLEEQIRQLKPNIHVYGHSHLNQQRKIDGIQYINNAFGYPAEDKITSKQLLCIFET